MIAIDTNILAYAFRSRTPQHNASRKAIERAFNDSRGWGISLPCISEFWSVVTHPMASGGPSTGQQAHRFIQSLVDELDAHVWAPEADFADRLMKTSVALSVTGARVFDLQIGLIAIDHGAEEIWTHDRNFLKLRHLRVRDPLS